MQPTRELKTLKLSEIKPYPNNPRKNDNAVETVTESIKQCGYCAPIAVDEAYIILAGHTRLKAIKKLGWKEAEVLVISGLTEEQKKKYRLLDNKTAEMAGWDFPMLEEELAGIEFDMAEFGFIDQGEIDLDGLFVEREEKPKEPHMVTCPHCGESFEA